MEACLELGPPEEWTATLLLFLDEADFSRTWRLVEPLEMLLSRLAAKLRKVFFEFLFFAARQAVHFDFKQLLLLEDVAIGIVAVAFEFLLEALVLNGEVVNDAAIVVGDFGLFAGAGDAGREKRGIGERRSHGKRVGGRGGGDVFDRII